MSAVVGGQSLGSGSSEVRFYQLQRATLAEALPRLVEKARAAGMRVVVQVTTAERRGEIDELLWTYDDESFLPHVTDADADAAQADILVALAPQAPPPPGRAEALFLIDGAALPDEPTAYARVLLVFDGADEEATQLARERWRAVKAAGLDASYWAQDEGGRWIEKATTKTRR